MSCRCKERSTMRVSRMNLFLGVGVFIGLVGFLNVTMMRGCITLKEELGEKKKEVVDLRTQIKAYEHRAPGGTVEDRTRNDELFEKMMTYSDTSLGGCACSHSWTMAKNPEEIFSGCQYVDFHGETIRACKLVDDCEGKYRQYRSGWDLCEDLPEIVLSEGEISRLITVAIKTYERPHCVVRAVQAVKARYHGIPIVIVDDSSRETQAVTKEMIDQLNYDNVKYIQSPIPNIGLSAGRNLLLDHVETEYIFMTDDDHMFNEFSDLSMLLKDIMRTGASIAGGTICPDDTQCITGPITYELNSRVLNVTVRDWRESDIGSCVDVDHVENIFLARVADIRQVRWNDRLRIEWEHEDFFLRMKKLGKRSRLCHFAARHAKRACWLESGGEVGDKYFQGRYRDYSGSVVFHNDWEVDVIDAPYGLFLYECEGEECKFTKQESENTSGDNAPSQPEEEAKKGAAADRGALPDSSTTI